MSEAEAAKMDLLKRIEAELLPEAVLGVSTSSLKLETLASALSHPERFVGLHFFSPVPAMELVELGWIAQTAESALPCLEHSAHRSGRAWCASMGHPDIS